jgi:ACS family hexuronate transporter-like MFS transporter
MRIRHLRWYVITLIFFATVINYIDRQTLAVLKGRISGELGLTNSDYAAIQNSFVVFYAASQMVSGRIYDAIGTRLGFVFSIVVWSGAAMMHAFSGTRVTFQFWRAVLGFGEAGNWPGAAKAVGEWFPVRERALGMGIFNAGAALGGAVSPPIIAWLALSYGWRSTFVLTGLLGFAWLAVWLVVYHVPERHRWITDAERHHILDDRQSSTAAAQTVWKPGWGTLLTYRQTWAVVLGRFISDPIWWLYIFWLPAYFQEARGFSLRDIGASAWLPFLFAGIGALGGGWASGHLISRGWSVDRARKTMMAAGALLTPLGIVAVQVESAWTALVLMGIVLFGFQVWVNNLQTLPSDFFPKSAVASVFGLGGTAAGLATFLYTWGTGRVADSMGYTPVFVVAGVLGPVAMVVTFVLARRIEPLRPDELR